MTNWDEYQQFQTTVPQQGSLPPAQVPVPKPEGMPAQQTPSFGQWLSDASPKLMALGAGLLEASGPSTTPVSFGQALGRGINNMLKYDLQYGSQGLTKAKFLYDMQRDATTDAYKAKQDDRNYDLNARKVDLEEAYKDAIVRKNELDIQELENKLKSRQILLNKLFPSSNSSTNKPIEKLNDIGSAVTPVTPSNEKSVTNELAPNDLGRGSGVDSLPPQPSSATPVTPITPELSQPEAQAQMAPQSSLPSQMISQNQAKVETPAEKISKMDPLEQAAIVEMLTKGDFDKAHNMIYGTVPSGYMRDPNNPGKLMEIPGGPNSKMTSQNAGIATMLEQADSDLQKLTNRLIDKSGRVDRDLLREMNIDIPLMGSGIPGTEGRTYASYISNAIAAKLRSETGAQANDKEIAEISKRFSPSLFDNDETVRNKISRLQDFMKEASSKMDPQRGPATTSSAVSSKATTSSASGNTKRSDALKLWLKRNDNKMIDAQGRKFDDIWNSYMVGQ